MADEEVSAQDPNAFALMLDHNGNIAEGRGSNIFFVSDGCLYTPQERYVLPGISRQTVKELARDISLPCIEKDYDLYDAYNSDEAFVTGTFAGVIPVIEIDGKNMGKGSKGQLTNQIQSWYTNDIKNLSKK